MLDTHTPDHDNLGVQRIAKRIQTERSRRLFSRMLLGLMIPGFYWFLTWTTPKERPLRLPDDWNALRRWIKRTYPGADYCYVITKEGNGVIHLVLRMKKNQRFKIKQARRFWTGLTGARQMKFEKVTGKAENLANYFADQRKKRIIGTEFSWQSSMVAWRYSAGWLPKGFAGRFPRFWYEWLHVPADFRQMMLVGWLLRCVEDPAQVRYPPRVQDHFHDGTV